MTNILVASGQIAFRDAFAETVERSTGYRVTIRAATLDEARRSIEVSEVPIDVALVDRLLPDGHGCEMRAQLHTRFPDCHLVVIGLRPNRPDFARAAAAGAAGMFAVTAGYDEIMTGVARLLAGDILVPRSERLALLNDSSHHLAEEQAIRTALGRLTPRESDVLNALAHGLSDKETAAQLGLSTKTVATHMTSLLDKLNVDSRLKAVLIAIRYNAVRID